MKFSHDVSVLDLGEASGEEHEQRPPGVRQKHRHPSIAIDVPPRDPVQQIAHRQCREPHQTEHYRYESVIYRERIERAEFRIEGEDPPLSPDLTRPFLLLGQGRRRHRRGGGGVAVSG